MDRIENLDCCSHDWNEFRLSANEICPTVPSDVKAKIIQQEFKKSKHNIMNQNLSMEFLRLESRLQLTFFPLQDSKPVQRTIFRKYSC